MDKNIGVILDGRYEVKKRIGVGGMADVYRAFDRLEGRDVAVKILKNEYTKSLCMVLSYSYIVCGLPVGLRLRTTVREMSVL